MPDEYIVRNTEKTQPSAREKELETLLYMFSVSADKDSIKYYIIDVFNDLTGTDARFGKGYDFQSKAEKGESPKLIGENLLTLFKNYLSGFPFCSYTLFYGGASGSTIINSALEKYDYTNFHKEKLVIVADTLFALARKKGYFANRYSCEEDIEKGGKSDVEKFLKVVCFVQPKMDACGYIKNYLRTLGKSILNDAVCATICKKIKDAQQSLKDFSLERVSLRRFDEVSMYGHHIDKNQIKEMILNTVLSCKIFDARVKEPKLFEEFVSGTPIELKRDKFIEAQNELALAYLTPKMDAKFWRIFRGICNIFDNDHDVSLSALCLELTRLPKHPFMPLPSLVLLAGFIKEEYYGN